MNYQFLNADQLEQLVRKGQQGKDYAVVDVRDDDYRGGNLPGAIRAPSEQRTEQSVQDLVQQLKDVPTVIFHCTLSQVRGPKAARIYADAVSKAHAQQQHQPGPRPVGDSLGASASARPADFSPNPFAQQQRTDGADQQQVYVLRDGFAGWQALHRNDPALVENFDATIWS
ncbi:uncharacterized protein RHOBADRAFT_55236 [Rhodotorula graminis WP1]|uniref:Rhodanese domain-containing protein n=1 Tax=Rhodotorula graminis (strain WP1) TaxID=578459 RepID=A0A0P9FBM2_RHOGW|nr:uncharacterized protein RHOBADRAFT_55236 [Rhodotorula graminis WP1]KPV72990.1 hypothetical protein RHOBADRAFT_55236 [Rhodotorula graminis WP1]